MNYYCIFVETGKEAQFKNAAQKMIDENEAGLDGEILLFRQIKKIVKLNKVYDDLLFPSYLFFKTPETDIKKFRDFMSVDGFIKFLPDRKNPEPLAGKDLEIVTSLECTGEVQGFVRAKFDKDDRIVIVSGPLAGMKGQVVSVNRRNQKMKYNIVTETGIRMMNLSYFDVEKQDWTEEENEYMQNIK